MNASSRSEGSPGIPFASDISSASSSRQLLVVARGVAEHDPARDPPERAGATASQSSSPRAPRLARSSASASSRATAAKRSASRCSGLAGVEHRLGEPAPVLPTARRARSSARRAGRPPCPCAWPRGRRRTGRASPRAPGATSSRDEHQQRRVLDHPHPDRARGRGCGACPPAARPPGRRRPPWWRPRPPRGGAGRSPGRRSGTTTSALKRTFSTSAARWAARAPSGHSPPCAQPTLRQGANAFSTPSSAGASSGWWRSSTSIIVLSSTQSMPSGV